VQHSVIKRDEFLSATSFSQPSVNTLLNRFAPYVGSRVLRERLEGEDSDEDKEKEDKEESPTRRRDNPD
jgi:hypothetical protein